MSPFLPMPLPIWLTLDAAEVAADSRLQPHQMQASGEYGDTQFQAEITRRVAIQGAVVMSRIQDAILPLSTVVYSDDQQARVKEVVKLKIVGSILGSLPDEVFLGPARSARNDAEEILKGLESELKRAVAQQLQNTRMSGTSRILSPVAHSGSLLDVPLIRADDTFVVNRDNYTQPNPLPDLS